MIITIDGPSSVGKGTMALLLADSLDFELLDSGALYRVVALQAQNQGCDLANATELANIARNLDVEFATDQEQRQVRVLLGGRDVSKDIRNEKIAGAASQVASVPEVRKALLQRQRDFADGRGLIADGRDMGTVVFPSADVKFFLVASAKQRAKRRAKQLNIKQDSDTMRAFQEEIERRDARDVQRSEAPLKPAMDSITIDTSHMSIDQVLDKMLEVIK